MIESFIIATVVGVMEIAPGTCQMELLNPDGTINVSQVSCDMIITDYQPIHDADHSLH